MMWQKLTVVAFFILAVYYLTFNFWKLANNYRDKNCESN